MNRWAFFAFAILGASAVGSATVLAADPLETYIRQPDAHYGWKKLDGFSTNGCTVDHLQLTSQTWHGGDWTHHLRIVRPEKVRNPGTAFLYITGDGTGRSSLRVVLPVAERAGIVAVVLTGVPNQPLWGRNEDALIAYTFDRCLKTGDETWPLLFPMAKSAVRAMDAVQEFVQQEFQQKIEKFVVGGASKRGWTTWLTGAVDPRVAAIAPMVIDMLNMKAQTDWAKKVYGRQSEQIHDYTDLNLVDQLDSPPMQKLANWVDPYSRRNRYTMPKLLLLGTNDRYWTVDALRHYWADLPGPKLVFQTPNAGHDLGGGREAIRTLAAFAQMIAEGQKTPEVTWKFSADPDPSVTIHVDRPVQSIRLWTAESTTRDFRDAKWKSRDLEVQAGSSHATAQVPTPAAGYRAFMAEAILKDSAGQPYRLSTQVRVTPDALR